LYVSRSKHHNARSHTSTKEPKIHIGGATDSAKAEIATESRVTESNMDKIHENSSELLKCVGQNLAASRCFNFVWNLFEHFEHRLSRSSVLATSGTEASGGACSLDPSVRGWVDRSTS
jgi:hypothetical protein